MRYLGGLILLFFAFTNYCFSQISYGFKAGLNISDIKHSSAYKSNPEQISPITSYHISTFVEIPLGGAYFFSA